MEFQYALCITFFHSLWIGMILALSTSLIIITTKKSSAVIRYNLLTAVLFLFVIIMGFVFYETIDSGRIHQGLSKSDVSTIFSAHASKENITAINSTALAQGNSGILDGMRSLMDLWTSYSTQIVMIWFLIICIKCIQLIMGLHAIHYLKNTQVFSAGRFWEKKVAELSVKLNISKNIQILQSGITKVPVVAGHLKPIILLPLGLLNGLSTAEVEAIISHELAHIKRSDYLVNIFQSLIEIVFFFNPAVLWLSKLIREERENCCDDLALSCTSNKQDYIQALVSCQEFQSNNYAMAFTGRKNQLLERVSRMVFNKSSSLNRVEKIILTATLISTLVFTAAFTRNTKDVAVTKGPVPELTGVRPSYQDTTIKRNAKKNTTKIIPSNTQKKISYTKSSEEARESARIIAEQKSVIAEQKRLEAENAKVAQKIAQSQKDTDSKIHDAAGYKREITKYTAASHYPIPTVPVAPIPPVYNKSYAPAEPKDMTKELQNDGLLQQTNNFKYKLNEHELIINGKKQSDAVHEKYAKKYLENRKGTITTTVNTD
nr:M56 family metallopeptidase [Pedobacter panaciterrae]